MLKALRRFGSVTLKETNKNLPTKTVDPWKPKELRKRHQE